LRVAIRTDASVPTGSGHAMRCLALAEGLRARGAEVAFVCRTWAGHPGDRIARAGFRLLPLPGDCDPGGPDFSASDARATRAVLTALSPLDWLVVDHYGLDCGWEREFRARAQRILAIDDHGDRPHDCDLLLDQNLPRSSEDHYRRRVPPGCRLLLGPAFALLREQFARTVPRARDGDVRRLLIAFGGTDPGNLSALALAAVAELRRPDLAVDVVAGAGNPHRGALARTIAARPDTRLLYEVDDMAAVMDEADLAIGAAGSSSWERAARGLPALVISVADHQRPIAETLVEAGAVEYAGAASEATAAGIAARLRRLIGAPERLRDMAARARGLTDGHGVERVVDAMGVQGGSQSA
jgi:UDP-2,4-diacetamido-2,4,6-trideoxy-beta-L-altropyranose hydrolase